MLQLVLVFITIGVVSCETNNCPIFSAFKNKPLLFDELRGTFLKIVAISTSPVAHCQKQNFTIGPNNKINDGYFQSPDWCLHLNNCISNPEYQECDLTALSPITPGTLPSPERQKIKLVRKIGEGDDLCFIYSYCRASEEGMYALCRQEPDPLVKRFLTLLDVLPYVTVVNQTNCTYSNSCPPP